MTIATLGTNTIDILSTTVNHTLVAGTNRKAFAYISTENATLITATGVTYGGVAMSLVLAVSAVGAAANYISLWELNEASLPANGVNSVVGTLSGAAIDKSIFVRTLEGVAQTGPALSDTTSETAPGDGTIPNDFASPIAGIQWALSMASAGNAGAWAADGAQTEVDDYNPGSSQTQICDLRGGTGQIQLTSTFTGTLNRLIRLSAVYNAFGAPDMLLQGSTTLIL